MARKPSDIIKLQLRLPEALRRRLERAAAHSEHSMNAEIVLRLEQSFLVPELEKAIDRAAERAVNDAIFKYAAKTTEG